MQDFYVDSFWECDRLQADLSCKHNGSQGCGIQNHHSSFAENSSRRGRLHCVDLSRVTDVSMDRIQCNLQSQPVTDNTQDCLTQKTKTVRSFDTPETIYELTRCGVTEDFLLKLRLIDTEQKEVYQKTFSVLIPLNVQTTFVNSLQICRITTEKRGILITCCKSYS